jgi:hypothetical protein
LKTILHELFEEYKIVRRILVLWAIVTITWTTVLIFTNLALITAPVAAAYGTNVGLLTTVIAFYQWSRERDARGKPSGHNNK